MKANELMVGDYVTFRDCLDDGEILSIKVMELHGYDNEFLASIGGDEALDTLDIEHEIVGIPLTAEILEKNGFRFDGSGRRSMMFISEPHFADGVRFNIYVGLKHKTIEAFAAHPVEKSPNWRKSNKVYLEVCGCYVHELQHALRLCGIDKEIIL